MNLKRIADENEHQYIWRLCEAKENGLIDLDWKSLGEIFNKELCLDETEYKDESAYRKAYQYAKIYYEDVFKNQINNDDYLDELTIKTENMKKERYKLLDQRCDYNRRIRNDARLSDRLDMLENMIKNISIHEIPFNPENIMTEESNNDLLVILSDLHIGQTFDSFNGKYNSDIATDRLNKYFGEIMKIKSTNKSQDCYLSLQGDLISNSIHKTLAISNRENVIQQIQQASTLITGFIHSLSLYFNNVYFTSVCGNHSRLDTKDDSLKDERFDDLIAWYVENSTTHLKNVHMIKGEDNTFAIMNIRGKEYVHVHGDYDGFSKSGVSDLSMMLGHFPYAITYGHLHTCSMAEEGGVKLIRGGCFSGSGDDYTIQKRLIGKPTQMVCICTDDGIKAYYPVEL